jgi:hypothetical protein
VRSAQHDVETAAPFTGTGALIDCFGAQACGD